MDLKSQDIYVSLKLVARLPHKRPPYAQLAAELGMSASEVDASIKRAQFSRLPHGPELDNRPNLTAITEFLVHGLKYSFPAEHGEFARGLPTSYAAEPIRTLLDPGRDPVPVWPFAEGTERGISLKPLYKAAPRAALRDAFFYEYLAPADALRDGRSRERKFAETKLRRRFQEADTRSES